MNKIILSTIVTSVLLTGTIWADSYATKDANMKKVQNTVINNTKEDAKNTQVKLIDEALESLKLTTSALKDLENNNGSMARKNIELALGKLEVILSAENTPKLLPIDNGMRITNFLGSAEDVKKIVLEVKALLSANKVQEARHLLSTLQSEVDITVVNLPLTTYPDALKLASKYILEENNEEAKKILKLALSTFAEVHQTISLPLANTTHFITLASNIAKKDKELALKYLKGAKEALDKSEALGYISDSATTYKELHEKIETIEKEIKGPNKAEKLFKKLSEKLKEFKSKVLSSKEDTSGK